MKLLTKVALIAAIAVVVFAAYWIQTFFEVLGRMS